MKGEIGDFERTMTLRNGAVARMNGAHERGTPSMNASAALGVLHKLASSPATALEALALLHELQVYQIELEMQDEELRSARSEMEALLRRRQELYDFAPAALLTLDRQTQVFEINGTGERLLGVQAGGVLGWRLNSFLSVDDGQRLDSALDQIVHGQQRAACEIRLRTEHAADQRVHATVNADPAAPRFLVALVQLGGGVT